MCPIHFEDTWMYYLFSVLQFSLIKMRMVIVQNLMQLILEQHRSELCGSTYIPIFFNKYSPCIFIL